MEIRDYEMILDSIQSTGIYVIREDDHQILYFNKRMKEIAPGIATGMVCHDLWPGSCDNCPLLHMGERRQNHSIDFDAPFGKMVDISAAKTIWENEVPAIVLSIAPHAETLSHIYNWILRGNLTLDRFEMIKFVSEETDDLMHRNISLSAWLNQFLEKGYIYNSDTERFQSFIKPEYLNRELKQGKKKLICMYRWRTVQGYRWHIIEVVPAPDYSHENQIVMICIKDIHDVFREGLELEEISIQNQEVINSLGELNFGVYVVNLRTGTLNPVRVSEDMKEVVRRGILQWDDLLTEMAERFFHPEYKERILHTYSLEALRRAKAEGKDKLELLCL